MSTPRLYPAIDIVWPARPDDETIDCLLAELDDFAPTAVEDLPAGVRIFFTSPTERDRACDSLRSAAPDADISTSSVSDEAWAERSQVALGPVRVGRIIVAPPWSAEPDGDSSTIVVRIQPSMGFGTGHHASTRLCLALLQDVALAGRSVLDVGTGSGVLAIVAWRLGATDVLGIDFDEDALTSARENVEANAAGEIVALRAMDVTIGVSGLPRTFDVVTANLTGAMLERSIDILSAWVARGGFLIASGFQIDEADRVQRALESAGFTFDARTDEDTWVALRVRRTHDESSKLEARS